MIHATRSDGSRRVRYLFGVVYLCRRSISQCLILIAFNIDLLFYCTQQCGRPRYSPSTAFMTPPRRTSMNPSTRTVMPSPSSSYLYYYVLSTPEQTYRSSSSSTATFAAYGTPSQTHRHRKMAVMSPTTVFDVGNFPVPYHYYANDPTRSYEMVHHITTNSAPKGGSSFFSPPSLPPSHRPTCTCASASSQLNP